MKSRETMSQDLGVGMFNGYSPVGLLDMAREYIIPNSSLDAGPPKFSEGSLLGSEYLPVSGCLVVMAQL